jgi:hypothetical protein
MRYLLTIILLLSLLSHLSAQRPLDVDSTGNVVYYAEFKIDSDEIEHADRVFPGFINANFKDKGNPILFKNPTTHRMTAKCYFNMDILNRNLASLPAEGYCYFNWSYSIKGLFVRIYLYGIYFTSDASGNFAQQVATAEWLNDNYKEFVMAKKGAEKIDSQLRHYIDLFKDSLKH